MGLEPKTITYSYKNMATKVCLAFLILGSIAFAECRAFKPDEFTYHGINCRKHVVNLNKFGAKGDGTTSNTAAFRSAIVEVSKLASDGGAILVVPPGEWLTGPFNLTSSFTLYLQKGATILGSEVVSEYPLIEPLPSYGRGRDVGGRHANLISGYNLTDVVITGDNGTIDGQGVTWWAKYRSNELTNTRPYLIEIMNSDKVLISNVTLINSPSWHVHPVYSSSVIIRGVTILAPVGSPNTDGINPDSCTNVKIEDCYIESGDDCIAVKSGWDEYGIKYNRPMSHLIIRRLRCISPESAVIALGSEMSGGIQDVRAEDISAIDSESGIRIKSAPGRGGFVKDIFLKGMTLKTMKYVFWMSGDYGDHPDEKFDPNAFPVVQNINYANVVAENVNMSAKLGGLKGHPYTGICMSNVTIGLSQKPKLVQWNCTEIAGVTSNVTPQPCSLLPENKSGKASACAFPTDKLPIDQVELKTCSSLNSVQ